MNRRHCANCPHREYLHDDRAYPTGRCQVEGCDCKAFRPEGWPERALASVPVMWR